MKKITSSLLISALIVTSLISSVSALPSNQWTDVESDHWAYDDINALYDLGVVQGKSAGVYAPNDYVTQAEFTKMALEVAGIDETILTEGCGFSNMATNSWFYDYMYTFCALDLYHSPLGYFVDAHYPNEYISRQDAAVVVMRIANPDEYINASDGLRFSDMNLNDGTWSYVNTASFFNILTGYEEEGFPFKPNNNLTRAEAAAVINRTYNAFYSDDATFAHYVTALEVSSD